MASDSELNDKAAVIAKQVSASAHGADTLIQAGQDSDVEKAASTLAEQELKNLKIGGGADANGTLVMAFRSSTDLDFAAVELKLDERGDITDIKQEMPGLPAAQASVDRIQKSGQPGTAITDKTLFAGAVNPKP